MLREVLVLSVFGILLLGFATQLMDVAASTSEKTLDFTYDMQEAVDCATKGVDMRECSPNLYKHDFEGEIEKTIEINREFIDDIKAKAEDANLSVTQKDDVIVISK